MVHAAAEHAQQELTRVPRSMELQTPPSLKEQQLHELTHLPYQPWCASCVCFRARSDRHERSGAATRSSTPCISFDFGYTKSVPSESDAKRDLIDHQYGDDRFCQWICPHRTSAKQEPVEPHGAGTFDVCQSFRSCRADVSL